MKTQPKQVSIRRRAQTIRALITLLDGKLAQLSPRSRKRPRIKRRLRTAWALLDELNSRPS
jgi:hypothetical protein